MSDLTAIAARIESATGSPLRIQRQQTVGGGCINRALVLGDATRTFFVKLNGAERLDMFEAEAAGLTELRDAGALRVPAPICTGVLERESYLVIEHIDLGGRLDGAAAGRQLAELHRHTGPGFGWQRDNTIGATPQQNAWADDWVTFWRERRLAYQLELAIRNGHSRALGDSGERLCAELEHLIGHHPPASLLHGDLWAGNIGSTPGGEPVIFDPAVYFGDRETDLAMTELFGGFAPDFYAAYREAWPLPPEYTTRKMLYNLYHVLNHLNLFGGGYLAQSRGMIERLLATVR
ncbi:MAG: fructosamine kinase family protein [Sphingobacteriia bacterium]|nr:fructosamine kinase family protein [Sphingobacteriia bacterium]NCC38572.1 fructosamine kinase family protein [Gammaproteobacteria bacterium]